MIWFKRRERVEPTVTNPDWIGMWLVGRVTLERRDMMQGSIILYGEPSAVEMVDGAVLAVGKKCVLLRKRDGAEAWYEVNRHEIGGIDVIEVIPKSQEPPND